MTSRIGSADLPVSETSSKSGSVVSCQHFLTPQTYNLKDVEMLDTKLIWNTDSGRFQSPALARLCSISSLSKSILLSEHLTTGRTAKSSAETWFHKWNMCFWEPNSLERHTRLLRFLCSVQSYLGRSCHTKSCFDLRVLELMGTWAGGGTITSNRRPPHLMLTPCSDSHRSLFSEM